MSSTSISSSVVDLSILNDVLSAMHDPELVSAVEEQIDRGPEAKRNSSHIWKEELSFTPWVYHADPELNLKLLSVAKHNSDREQAASFQPKYSTTTATAPSFCANDSNATSDQAAALYPSWTYLDLREVQNHKFAQDRFIQGIQYAREKQYDKAESCYKKVLDLMPFHADCLVAYGALCASARSSSSSRNDTADDDRLSKAESLLKRAIEIDPQCPNAQNYLDQIAVEKQMQQKTREPYLSSNVQLLPQKALNDAIAERAILYGHDDRNNVHDELAEGLSAVERKREKKRRRDKKRKKKNRRRRGRDYDSSSSSNISLSNEHLKFDVGRGGSQSSSSRSHPSHRSRNQKRKSRGSKRKHRRRREA